MTVIKGRGYSAIDSYLDNDTSGQETLNFFTSELPGVNIESMSHAFAPFKDYNAFVMANADGSKRV